MKSEEEIKQMCRDEVNSPGCKALRDKFADIQDENAELKKEIGRKDFDLDNWQASHKIADIEIAELKAKLEIAVKGLKEICDVNRCDPVLDANDRETIAEETLEKVRRRG